MCGISNEISMWTDGGNSQNENWTLHKRWNWNSSTKMALSLSWIHGLIAQSVKESDRNWILLIITLIFIYLMLNTIQIATQKIII